VETLSFNIIAGNKSNPDLNEALCQFVGQRIGVPSSSFSPCGSIGIEHQGNIIASVIFHNWIPDYGVIELSAAADDPRWLSKTVIRTIMNICFEQHKCQQIYTRQSSENNRAIKIYRFLGFTEIILPNMRGESKDETLMLMTKNQWSSHKLNEAKNG
jgi:RimJ/RimL family protein N-acetyltransferase